MKKKLSLKKWEKEIIRKTNLFAKTHELHFDKGTELMILNAIREAKKHANTIKIHYEKNTKTKNQD